MARDTSNQSDITKREQNAADGEFKRPASTFRDTISKGGKHPPEKGRYHLYVSYACPWAHRTLIVRKLKGLEPFIDVSVVSPHMGSDGWPFASVDPFPGADSDPHLNAAHVKDLYLHVDPEYSGRFTVPVLWDKQQKTIVNNESSEIIRVLNDGFNDELSGKEKELDLYPENLRKEIDVLNEWVYNDINNGVYKCGFATTQSAYEGNVKRLFEALDKVEKILNGKKYLVGERLTESDVRLFTTIIRFDPVYVGHFKCNISTIRYGYPSIHKWLKNLYWNDDAFKSTTDFNHIKTHYYWSHGSINPHKVIPVGPNPDIEPLN